MPIKYITPSEAYNKYRDIPLIDVRSPAEYQEAHIPGAHNLPLFTNEERAEVGTIYKQNSPKAAFLRGLDFVGPKMRTLVEEAEQLTDSCQIQIHCWRGGQRSGSVAWLLDLSGFDVKVIKGGYKAYRTWVQSELSNIKAPLIIVGGPTGAGKTEVLSALSDLGEQVVDLENLARHKGSTFGALGESKQPTVRQFENDLWHNFQQLDFSRRIWLENESRAIGRVYIPEGFWAVMSDAPMFELKVSLSGRLDRLVRQYAAFSDQELEEAFKRIRKRLGGQHLNEALAALRAKNYHRAAEIALVYYDKAYHHHTFEKVGRNRVFPFPATEQDPKAIAKHLISVADQKNFE
ncbi:MAG: tRNA 2-selenouridine(34) synthase MnmH [Mameliella sp.]|nr:tRNA 2-selenouridine(34) synthase MnmH [Phaeodactylibacter sp.]NRA51426.1 tRNA 2-selenouridine(34) synthase MnmH [Phaeodactylibacter sp.]